MIAIDAEPSLLRAEADLRAGPVRKDHVNRIKVSVLLLGGVLTTLFGAGSPLPTSAAATAVAQIQARTDIQGSTDA